MSRVSRPLASRVSCLTSSPFPSLRRGSILMETVLVMPVLLLLIFGILQFAHIWMARQMVAYAAFCAARAAMVVPPNEQSRAAQNAAEIALSWINIASSVDNPVTIPGWGAVNGSGYSDNGRSRVLALVWGKGTNVTTPYVAAEVEFKFPLLIPGLAVNKIIANAVNAATVVLPTGDFYADLNRAAGAPSTLDGWPYVRLREFCVLPMPYSTAKFPTRAFNKADSDELIDIREDEGAR